MMMSTPTGDAFEVDVAIIGAGPTGLMAANLLSRYGVRVDVFEAGDALIDFPRGVGMDDETLRAFQAADLVDEVLPHTIPHQLLVFVDRKQRDLARLAPPSAEFGWPRRNGFVQPLADKVLLEGLARFTDARVHWSSQVTGVEQDVAGATLTVQQPGGVVTVRAGWVIGADGGSSSIRKAVGYRFEGSSAPANWLVVDIRNDPLGQPGSYVCADPRRPYVSISIPHGIRRFEFMMLRGETAEDAERPEFLASLLAPLVPGGQVDIIRKRVYTHHSRIAQSFRSGRVLLAGDAAHVMPVWQGQGYNSAIRDALNLSWKIALVVRGIAGPDILDSYELERREHVRAMMQLSTWVGSAVSVRNRLVAGLRDAFFRSISLLPAAKSYIVQMRFKPMPTMDAGALTPIGTTATSPVGRLFIQPSVLTRAGGTLRLDDALGPWFALIAWNNDPRSILDADALARLERLGVQLVTGRPAVQLHWDEEPPASNVLVVGDIDGSLKRWFDVHHESVLLIRPDRIVGGAAPAFAASDMVRGFEAAIHLTSAERAAAEPEARVA
jgi:3-(3-hydroxy-phenyl)propionate hydroxylase